MPNSFGLARRGFTENMPPISVSMAWRMTPGTLAEDYGAKGYRFHRGSGVADGATRTPETSANTFPHRLFLNAGRSDSVGRWCRAMRPGFTSAAVDCCGSTEMVTVYLVRRSVEGRLTGTDSDCSICTTFPESVAEGVSPFPSVENGRPVET
jgi:hypothetical protein